MTAMTSAHVTARLTLGGLFPDRVKLLEAPAPLGVAGLRDRAPYVLPDGGGVFALGKACLAALRVAFFDILYGRLL